MRCWGAVTAAAALTAGLWLLPLWSADAAGCVNGVYRAGCAGPNGAVGVRKGTAYRSPYYRAPAYRPPYYGHPYYGHPPPVAVVPGRPVVVVPPRAVVVVPAN